MVKIKGSDVQIINTKWNSDSESWKYTYGHLNPIYQLLKEIIDI